MVYIEMANLCNLVLNTFLHYVHATQLKTILTKLYKLIIIIIITITITIIIVVTNVELYFSNSGQETILKYFDPDKRKASYYSNE